MEIREEDGESHFFSIIFFTFFMLNFQIINLKFFKMHLFHSSLSLIKLFFNSVCMIINFIYGHMYIYSYES